MRAGFLVWLFFSPAPAIGWLSTNHVACGYLPQDVLPLKESADPHAFIVKPTRLSFSFFAFFIDYWEQTNLVEGPVSSSSFSSSCR